MHALLPSMRWLLPILTFLTITSAQLNASDVTYLPDPPDSNITSSTNLTTYGDFYTVPGSNPTVDLIDNIRRFPAHTLPGLALYQAIFTASMQICGELPTAIVTRSFRITVGELDVTILRQGDQGRDPVQYGDLCYAMRGVGELITMDQLYFWVEVRVITQKSNHVRANIVIEPKGGTGQRVLGSGTGTGVAGAVDTAKS